MRTPGDVFADSTDCPHSMRRTRRALASLAMSCGSLLLMVACVTPGGPMARDRLGARSAAKTATTGPTAEESLPNEQLRKELESRIPELEARGFTTQAQAVRAIVDDFEARHQNLEEMEQHLSAIEEKILAQARAAQTEAELLSARQDLDGELRPHRSRLSAAELTMLEKSFLDRRLFERIGARRLSLFFLL